VMDFFLSIVDEKFAWFRDRVWNLTDFLHLWNLIAPVVPVYNGLLVQGTKGFRVYLITNNSKFEFWKSL
jgi:hypothetical protein